MEEAQKVTLVISVPQLRSTTLYNEILSFYKGLENICL